jgi:iron complex outermembrane receptor protein
MWNAAIFQIQRPLAYDVYDANNYVYTRHLDGTQKHQGLELGTHYAKNNLTLGAQIQALRATIADVEQTSGVIGNKPTNVPSFVFRGLAEYRYSSVPGLRTNLRVSHESERNVLEDGSVKLPAWTTWGTAAHYDTKVNNVASTWSLAIDNLTDKRYWRESPKQFGHYYLYPGAPRTLRATVQFRM